MSVKAATCQHGSAPWTDTHLKLGTEVKAAAILENEKEEARKSSANRAGEQAQNSPIDSPRKSKFSRFGRRKHSVDKGDGLQGDSRDGGAERKGEMPDFHQPQAKGDTTGT